MCFASYGGFTNFTVVLSLDYCGVLNSLKCLFVLFFLNDCTLFVRPYINFAVFQSCITGRCESKRSSLSQFWTYVNFYYAGQCADFAEKLGATSEFSGARRVPWSKFRAEGTQIPGVTIQHLGPRTSWHSFTKLVTRTFLTASCYCSKFCFLLLYVLLILNYLFTSTYLLTYFLLT